MKKGRLLVAILFAAIMAFSALALSACGKDENPEPEKNVDMTEGVYNVMMEKYELLIKFYDEDTYYFQNEEAGFRGKYEIKDEEITFSRSQPDGTDYNSQEHPGEARWITGNKVIYFYQEDGTTPIDYKMNVSEQSAHDPDTIVKGTCYAYGTKPHTLAYNTETDQIQSFAGKYGSRTLSHTKLRNFTVKDEKAIEQAKFMVKELPENAEAGKVESDYFLTLSQKGYETNIPALAAWELTNGKFVQNGNEYALTDTISGEKATLTVTQTGATVTKGEESLELVVWEDVKPYAVEVTGSAHGGQIKAKVRFNEDGTLTIFGSAKNYAGSYEAKRDGTITVSGVDEDSPVTFGDVTFETAEGVTTVTAALTIAAGDSPVLVTATGRVTGKLYGLEAAVVLEADSKEKVFGDTGMKMEMKDDCTIVLSVGGQPKVTAFWFLDTSVQVPSVSFRKVSAGALKFTMANPCAITWTGRLSETETEDRTYTFEFASSDLAKLQGAKVAEKHVVNGEAWNGRETKIVFYADGTLEVNVGGSAIAAAEWTFAMSGGKPSVSVTNCSKGTLTPGWGSGDTDGKYVFTWVGRVSEQMPNDSTLVFAMPTAELANLR